MAPECTWCSCHSPGTVSGNFIARKVPELVPAKSIRPERDITHCVNTTSLAGTSRKICYQRTKPWMYQYCDLPFRLKQTNKQTNKQNKNKNKKKKSENERRELPYTNWLSTEQGLVCQKKTYDVKVLGGPSRPQDTLTDMRPARISWTYTRT